MPTNTESGSLNPGNGLKKYTDEGSGLQKLGEKQKSELAMTISAIRKWSDLGNSMADDMASDLVAFERQAKELGIEGLVVHLEGPTAVAFGYEDATAPARILNTFAQTHKKLELKAGVVEGIVYDAEGVKVLASIPSKEVLIAKLLGSFKAPLSNLAYLLNAVKEKKESEQ